MGTQFILVGLLCLCGLSFGEDCRRELLENWDFPGSDILILRSPDVHHCQHLCTQHASCLFFAFIGPNCIVDNRHFYCFLKATASGQPTVQGLKQGTTVGYSLRPCNPNLNPCLSEVYNGVDFWGSDYQTFFTADYQECQRACTQDPGCQFFTFLNGEYTPERFRYKCYLKFSGTVPVLPHVVAAPGKVSGFSPRINQLYTPSSTTLLKPPCKGILFPDIDYIGNDIEIVLASSPEQCQALCSAHPRCTHFSYTRDIFKCYLKNNPYSMVPTAVAGITSGLPARFCQLPDEWTKKTYEGIDFPHSDLRNFKTADVAACREACNQDPNCQFFSYLTDVMSNPAARRLCYLKRVIILPSPPKVTKLFNAVSGFSLKNCI